MREVITFALKLEKAIQIYEMQPEFVDTHAIEVIQRLSDTMQTNIEEKDKLGHADSIRVF